VRAAQNPANLNRVEQPIQLTGHYFDRHTQMKRLARKADLAVRMFVRLTAAIAVLVAAVVYLNYGTLSPCGVLREAIRQHGDLAAVLPDGVIDFSLEAQFGEMSADRCLVILLNNLIPAMPPSAQVSRSQSAQPPGPGRAHQKASPSAPKLLPWDFE
jgi:hypothetical protein